MESRLTGILQRKQSRIEDEVAPSLVVQDDEWHPWLKVDHLGRGHIAGELWEVDDAPCGLFSYSLWVAMRTKMASNGVEKACKAWCVDEDVLNEFFKQRPGPRKLPAHESESLKGAIRDLRLYANGHLDSKYFLARDCPHSVHSLMYLMRHGSASNAAHIITAHIGAQKQIQRSLQHGIRAVKEVVRSEAELKAVTAGVEKAAKLLNRLYEEDNVLVSDIHRAEEEWATLLTQKFKLHGLLVFTRYANVVELEDKYNEVTKAVLIARDALREARNPDPATFVSPMGRQRLKEGKSWAEIMGKERRTLKSALHTLAGRTGRAEVARQDTLSFIRENEDPELSEVGVRRTRVQYSGDGDKDMDEQEQWSHRRPNFSRHQLFQDTEESKNYPWNKGAQTRLESFAKDGCRNYVPPEVIQSNKRARRDRKKDSKGV